jgi:hypothetical protein
MRAWLLLAIALGCRSQPLVGSAGPAPLDGGACPGALAAVPIESFTPEDLNVCPSTLARVQVTFQRPSCDRVAALDGTVAPGGSDVSIVVRIWRSGACSDLVPDARTVRVSDFGALTPGPVSLRDGSGGAAMGALFVQVPPLTGDCSGPNGNTCSDAGCEASDAHTRCDLDLGGCVRVCFSDDDCLPAAPRCTAGTCTHGPTSCAAVSCGAGASCVVGAMGAWCQGTPACFSAGGAS